jgi:cysteinyl-tRNA synthetase
MQLRLYDTLTRQKRPFEPIDRNNVRIYACGPTVYDFAHIGNGRAAIVFDLLFRVLRHHFGAEHVKYVRNVTDVDDKINVRAARDYPGLALNEAIRKVTEETYQHIRTTSPRSAAWPRRCSRARPSTSRKCARSSRSSLPAALPMSPKTTCCSRRRR